MSWQTYVDINLMGNGHNQHAAILSRGDGKLLAASSGFHIAPDEVEQLGQLLRSPQEAMRGSVTLAGSAYPIKKAERDALHGRQGPISCCVAQSKECIVVSVSRETGTEAGPVVCEGVRDFLVCSGH
eukprot:GGOE01001436.1.p2 GENE.GGOE01001436.1~~GGOE01001436.1.p2  ORF type:complete len:127 (-),score=38.70 GGOE01001436.1:149-529(-)